MHHLPHDPLSPFEMLLGSLAAVAYASMNKT